ncbi:MAG TPA: trypsin-like peptidase domain-containing protein [Terrimesophilobacter sp.]|nr:trypsin-like peptidase domain-containing protein [Terrimesophilobacter sp.]
MTDPTNDETRTHNSYGPSLDEMWAPAYRPTPQTPNVVQSQPRASGVSMPVVAAILGAALIGGVSGAGVAIWAVGTNQGGTTPGFVAAPPTITVTDSENASLVTAIAATAGPSVVTIHVSSAGASGTGSGVFLTSDGYIVTNSHVVSIDGGTGTPTYSVSTGDGRLFDGELIGADPLSDLAVIKVDSDTPFTPIEFGDSSNLNVGDLTVAIGAPLGLSNTVTNGIVSALHRSITVPSSEAPDGDAPENVPESPFDFWEYNGPGVGQQGRSSTLIYLPVIQTDASINPGNSGGALLNSSGELIGINVAIAGTGSASTSGSIGLGFAIPSNLVQRITGELIDAGEATHGLLGVTVMDTTSDDNIPQKQILGASVQSVTAGGAAGAAGVRVGDIITGFNGLPITGSIDLTAQVRAAAPGSEATVTFVRSGESRTVTVTLGELS